ncbi:MAG: hypothetical protein SPG61_00325 [Arcanobacterium sp.]|nr:hypothetical protein [Arcanobacterium sp.]
METVQVRETEIVQSLQSKYCESPSPPVKITQELSTEKLLTPAQWYPRVLAHKAEADKRTAAHVQRRKRGEKHPLEDFLYEYYPLRPRRFANWHPGVTRQGEPIVLLKPCIDGGSSHAVDALAAYEAQAKLPWYIEVETAKGFGLCLDLEFLKHREKGIKHLFRLHSMLLEREAIFGCLGWHEWAMVYRVDETRHQLPLRLGQERTDELVEQAHIRCTHFDAFRFFAPEAAPLNQYQPSYETVLANEQPGCIHVSMDILRSCLQLAPLVPGELLIAAYDLALQARTVDMAASPYDCSSLGLVPISIETQAGKAQYIAAQRELAIAAKPLRKKLVEILCAVNSRLERKF